MKKVELAVGAFLLLALASLLVLAFATTNGKWGLGGDTYALTAKFPNTGALRINAPVKVGGVAIGSVSKIELDKNYDAVATLAIKNQYKLSEDTSASILTSGLLGESFVNLQPGGAEKDLQPGEAIYLTQGSVDLMSLVGKFMFSGGEGKDQQNGGKDEAPAAAPASKDNAPAEKATEAPAADELPDYLKDSN